MLVSNANSSVSPSISQISVSTKGNENYVFRAIDGAGDSLKTPNFKTLFMKWGLNETMSFTRFSYDPYLHVANTPAFLNAFFGSDEFAANFVTLRDGTTGYGGSQGRAWKAIGKVKQGSSQQHLFEKINSNFTNLTLFDPLFEDGRGVLRSNGSICGCFEEITDDNELVRDMLQQ